MPCRDVRFGRSSPGRGGAESLVGGEFSFREQAKQAPQVLAVTTTIRFCRIIDPMNNIMKSQGHNCKCEVSGTLSSLTYFPASLSRVPVLLEFKSADIGLAELFVFRRILD